MARQVGQHVLLAVSLTAVVAMCAFIFAMSDVPADESDSLSLAIVDRVVELVVPGFGQMLPADQERWRGEANHIVRKTGHFLEYAVLGALALNLFWQMRRARLGASCAGPRGLAPLAAGAWLFATAYAATDEFHQLFVAGRSGMPADVALDSAGALLGVLALALVLASRGQSLRGPGTSFSNLNRPPSSPG